MSLLVNINIKNQDIIAKNKQQSLQNRYNFGEKEEEKVTKKEVEKEGDKRKREEKDIVYNSSNPRQLEQLGKFPYHEIGAGGMLPYRFGGCFIAETRDRNDNPALQITNLLGTESVTFSPSLSSDIIESEDNRGITVDLLTETQIIKEYVYGPASGTRFVDYIILPGPRESCIVYCWAGGDDYQITATRRISYSASENKSGQASPDCGGTLVDSTESFDYKEYIEGPEITQTAQISQASFGKRVAAYLVTETEIRQISAPPDAGEVVSKLSLKYVPGQILSEGTVTRGTVNFSGWNGGLEPFLFDEIYYNLSDSLVFPSVSYYKIYDVSYGGIEYQDFPGYHQEKVVLFTNVFGVGFWFEGNPWVPYGEFSGRTDPPYQSFDNFYGAGGFSVCVIEAERPPNPEINDVVFDDRFRKDWGYLVDDNDPTGRWVVNAPQWQTPTYDINDSGLNTFDLFYSPLSSLGGEVGMITSGIFLAIDNLPELLDYQFLDATQIVEYFPNYSFPKKSVTFLIESGSSVDTVTFFGYPALDQGQAQGTIVRTVEVSNEFGSPVFTWDWNRPNECRQLLEEIGFTSGEF